MRKKKFYCKIVETQKKINEIFITGKWVGETS